MAFHILIEKISETELTAHYCFKSDSDREGIFQINKKTGEVSLEEPMPEDQKGHVFNRAAVKIIREWKQGNLPALTEWAS